MAVATITVVCSNIFVNGSLHKTQNLSGELKSPPDSLYQWNISNEAPFKYRILHKTIVKSTYQLLKGKDDNNVLFFEIYRAFAFLFHATAILIFYFFLTQVKLRETAIYGAIIFGCLPAMFFAYNVPVHTREDTLAYCILLLGLVATIKNNEVGIFLFALLGVVCRETLLILPFVNLFFNTKQKLHFRLLLAGLCFGIFVSIRLYFGTEPYNQWEGFNWNRTHPVQVLAFTFVTFGVLWLPFLQSVIFRQSEKSLLQKSAPYVSAIVFVTTFAGGIFNEIRILFLIAPWVIYLGLIHWKENREVISSYLKSDSFKQLSLVALIVIGISGHFILRGIHNYIKPSRYDIPYNTWVIVSLVQIYFVIICLPYFYNRIRASITKS